ncbi:uncharacterized protein PgNI_08991 [Pyricularia grisea]|uniref:Uncharacterized protein n=1 Tax=Pyricularia grisea TaxID=148305 RepID=A0A6P8AUP6_PYRGI|nr:uncharacterized protein PgNI_08991 [Pyricularia grisea]TLD05946.1 hypothetical protein PgNI_08991 [Pyricularia grisea]
MVLRPREDDFGREVLPLGASPSGKPAHIGQDWQLNKQSRDRGLDLNLALALFPMQPTVVERLARWCEGLDSDGRGGCGYGLLLAPRGSS